MLIIFPSVHWTLTAEKALIASQVAHQVVPVPPHVNEGCGLGIRITADIYEIVLEVFQKERIQVEQVLEA